MPVQNLHTGEIPGILRKQEVQGVERVVYRNVGSMAEELRWMN